MFEHLDPTDPVPPSTENLTHIVTVGSRRVARRRVVLASVTTAVATAAVVLASVWALGTRDTAPTVATQPSNATSSTSAPSVSPSPASPTSAPSVNSPTASVGSLDHSCTSDQLQVRYLGSNTHPASQGRTSVNIIVTLTNTSDQRCHLQGFPTVSLQGEKQAPPLEQEAAAPDNRPWPVITLDPGASGNVGLTTFTPRTASQAQCGFSRIVLTPPGEEHAFSVAVPQQTTTCDSGVYGAVDSGDGSQYLG